MKINYFVLGTNDLKASTAFYNALFENTDLTLLSTTERMVFWQGNDFSFAIAKPFNQEPATNGNGTMVGISLSSNDEVKRLYNKVIELGGTCEGAPSADGPYFSAYVRDLDKNKLCFYQFSSK